MNTPDLSAPLRSILQNLAWCSAEQLAELQASERARSRPRRRLLDAISRRLQLLEQRAATGCTPRQKCSREHGACWSLVELLAQTSQGIHPEIVTSIHTGKSRRAGFVAQSGATRLMLNWCPFCGADVRWWEPEDADDGSDDCDGADCSGAHAAPLPQCLDCGYTTSSDCPSCGGRRPGAAPAPGAPPCRPPAPEGK